MDSAICPRVGNILIEESKNNVRCAPEVRYIYLNRSRNSASFEKLLKISPLNPLRLMRLCENNFSPAFGRQSFNNFIHAKARRRKEIMLFIGIQVSRWKNWIQISFIKTQPWTFRLIHKKRLSFRESLLKNERVTYFLLRNGDGFGHDFLAIYHLDFLLHLFVD